MEKSSYKKSCLTGVIAILVYMIVPDIAIPVLKMFNLWIFIKITPEHENDKNIFYNNF